MPTAAPMPAAACQSLADVRREIDRLDEAIVLLIAERGSYVMAAARFKRSPEEVHAPARVEQVIAHVRDVAQRHGGLPDVVEATYRTLIETFTVAERAEQRRLAELQR